MTLELTAWQQVDLVAAATITCVADTYARLAWAADYGTLEEYAALLHPDVVWEMPALPATGLPAQVRSGRDEVLAGASERRASGIQGPGSATWHVLTNVAVTPVADSAGTEATATAYWHFITGVNDKPRLLSTGVYRDRFVRAEAGWVLAHRTIQRG